MALVCFIDYKTDVALVLISLNIVVEKTKKNYKLST